MVKAHDQWVEDILVVPLKVITYFYSQLLKPFLDILRLNVITFFYYYSIHDVNITFNFPLGGIGCGVWYV